MAEQLGEAVLSLSVDLEGFKKQLDTARSIAEKQKPVSFKFDVSNAQQQFRKLETSAKTLEAQFNKLLGTPLNLNAKNLEKLGSDVLKAGTSINDFTRSVINGEKPLANSVASLQQQGQAFRTLAANVKIGSAEFRNFTQAAAQANQKQLFAGFEEIKSLQSLFKLGGFGGQSSFKGTEDLLAFSRKIGDTPAAINLYTQALQQALSVTSVTDANFAKLTAEIERQASALERAQSAASRYNQIFGAQPKALPPGRGPSQFVFSAEETPEERRARERRERRALKIQDIQTYASTGGRDPLSGFGRILLGPNREAIQAEQKLAAERKKTAAESGKATKAEGLQAARRRKDILSNALIGGAFPALFGQGLGASLGGAAGGAAGGAIGGQFGFGLSLVGTALGAQFDVALNKAKELAKALDNPITQFSAIKDNALLSSKGLEKNVEALIATGREAEAAAIIQEDLAKTFGNVQEVQNFVNETDKLNRAWTETSVTLAAFVAGPLAGLLGRLNEPARAFNVAGRVARATAGLSSDQRAQVEQFTRRRQRELGVPGIAATDLESLQLNLDILTEIERIQGKNNGALERAARNQKTIAQNTKTIATLEESISRARIGGNKPLEESLNLSRSLVEEYRKRKQLEQQLLAGTIKAPTFSEEFKKSQRTERALQQDFIDSSRETLLNATKELQVTKQLAGLEGVRLEVAQRRIDLSAAFAARAQREQEFTDADTAFSLDPASLTKRILRQGAQEAFVTAGVAFENKLRQAADYLKKAAKDAAQNLTTAILGLGKLESDPGGLNRFLTQEEQFQSNRRAILRLGGDGSKGPSQLESAITKATELLGITRNQANERFQGLRDIVSGARQGRFATQEGFNTLSTFFEDVKAREQGVTGLGDAQKTLADITSLNVTVQQELVGAVKENTVALNAVFGKDWSVNLAVQGGEVAAYGDVLSRNLTP